MIDESEKEAALSLSLDFDRDGILTHPQRVQKMIEGMFRRDFPQRLSHATFYAWANRQSSPLEDEKARSRLMRLCSGFGASDGKKYLEGPSIAFYGPPGGGKTYAAVCVAKEAAWIGRTSRYTTVSGLAREVRSTFHSRSKDTEEEILKRYIETQLLILDEIGAGSGSDHERAMFQDVLYERYNRKRPSILISNLMQDDLKRALGDRIVDRLREDGGFLLPFLGESRRKVGG